jgi:porphobilinogen synthase
MREMVAETTLLPQHLIQPVFVREGLTAPREIAGMPGVLQHTEESVLAYLEELVVAKVPSVMFFAVPKLRDELGSQAYSSDGILSRVVRSTRERFGDSLVIIADLCLDEFTSHGHCGVLDNNGVVDNDATLELYCKMAAVLSEAGAHLLGTSGMMDGQVGAIRKSLDSAGHVDVGILAYAAKYASAFYGPFRNAVESELDGDRKTYQQDYRNRKESLREVALDIEQGADIVMVKPAMSYLDIVSDVAKISPVPVAAYVVSGEYAMVEAAAAAGLIDRLSVIFEMLYSVRRAGAQIICTYWALEIAREIESRKF